MVAGCGSGVVVAERKLIDDEAGSSAPPGSGMDAGLNDGQVPEVVVLCGTARCSNRKATFASIEVDGLACCADPKRSACGIVEFASSCVPLHQEGRIDTTCPGLQNTGIGSLQGCCQPGGTCGVFDDSELGLGCTQIPFLPPFANCIY
jgi:hypothetical protein